MPLTAGVIHYGGWWVLSNSLKELKAGWAVWIVSNLVFFSLVLMMVIAEESHVFGGVGRCAGAMSPVPAGDERSVCPIFSPTRSACAKELECCWAEPPTILTAAGEFSTAGHVWNHEAFPPSYVQRSWLEKLAAGPDFRLQRIAVQTCVPLSSDTSAWLEKPINV